MRAVPFTEKPPLPFQVLFSKSRDPYKEAPLGVIEEGAWADMNIYNNNPLEDIMVVAKPKDTLKVVIKGGKVWKNEL